MAVHTVPDLPLSCRHLSLGYGETPVIDDLSVDITPGSITVLLGANGCGKSTLLKGMAGLLKPRAGAVYLQGEAVHRVPGRKLAKQLAMLTQSPQVNAEMMVKDLVALGRHPYRHIFSPWSSDDRQAVEEALVKTQSLPFADRRVATLSGGQRQRVWIAMALAQDTPWLLLDEPTTYLDLTHQIAILDLLKHLNETRNISLVMVLHDVNLACRYADSLVLIKRGRLYAQGDPASIVTPEAMYEVFGLQCEVIDDPVSCTPLCIPHMVGYRHQQE